MRGRLSFGLAVAVVLIGVGCAAPRVASTERAPARRQASIPEMTRINLIPEMDAVAHDGASFRSRSMHDEVWLMAGADERGRHWYTWLQFDLTVLPDDWQAERATLWLYESHAESIRNEVDAGEFLVFVALQPVDEPPAWDSQPTIERLPVAQFRVEAGQPIDQIALGPTVRRALESGLGTLTLVVVPRQPDVPFRRLWVAAESQPDSEHLVSVTGTLPRLELVAGLAPAPLRASERDRLLPRFHEDRP